MPDVDTTILKNLLDQLKPKLNKAVIALATVSENRVHLVVGVTKNTVDQINAGKLVSYLAEQLGGKGGGRPDMAQGSGDRIEALEKTLSSVQSWVKEKIGED